jgi:hypothetical protein
MRAQIESLDSLVLSLRSLAVAIRGAHGSSKVRAVLLREVIDLLTEACQLVNALLVGDLSSPASACERLRSEAVFLVAQARRHGVAPDPDPCFTYRLARASHLERDLRLASHQGGLNLMLPKGHTCLSWRRPTLQPSASHTPYSWGDCSHAPPPHNRHCALWRTISQIRETECSLPFRKALALDQRAAAETYRLEPETFSYGTTSYASWCDLVRSCDDLGEAVRRGVKCTVFGSSTGLLVFYTALGMGLPSEGIEILPALVRTSAAVAQRCAAPFLDLITLQCGDMLHADISATGILVLTSLCWEEALVDLVVAKLIAELPVGRVAFSCAVCASGVRFPMAVVA